MNDIILIALCIIITIIALFALYSMPSAFLKEFEKSCHETINKRDRDKELKEKLNKEFRKWLFK